MLYKFDVSLVYVDIHDNFFYAKITSDNYEKLKKIKTSYDIKIVRKYGFVYFKELLINNIYFLLFSFLGILLLFLLSNFIFSVEVIHDDSSIRSIVLKELENYNIKKFSFVKDYDYIQKVKSSILNSNNSSIEWIEIERVGTKYLVKLEKRIINNIQEENSLRHIVAKKDIIISGEIHKGEDVKGKVSAFGNVYAEVWYKVNVSLPINYYEEKYTGKNKYTLNFSFIDFDFDFFGNKFNTNKVINKNILYSDFFDMFSISFNDNREMVINDGVNLITSEEYAVKLARDKIQSKLSVDEYIISQKKLKTTLNDSTISVEIFFKVYEDISEYKYFFDEEGLR